MATVTLRSGVANTANNAALASASFTPTAGELLVVCAMHTGKTTDPVISVSANGFTFTKVLGPILKATSADEMSVFISDQFAPGSPAAMTVTTTPTASSGAIIFVWSIAGLTRTGLSAVLKSGSQANAAAAGTPAVALGGAALTANPLVGAVFNAGTAASVATPPTGWTETATIGDVGYTVPAGGGEAAQINSGFTGSTVTWGAASATAFCSFALELDTSALPPKQIDYRSVGDGRGRGPSKTAAHVAARLRAAI